MLAKTRMNFAAVAALFTAVAAGFLGGQWARALEAPKRVVTLISASQTITGEKIAYPVSQPAKVTAVVLTLQPGEETGWHTHGVPTFGYVLDGEVTVDYGDQGRRTYHAGEAVLEAMSIGHNGRNNGTVAMRILAVYMGAEGVQATEAIVKN